MLNQIKAEWTKLVTTKAVWWTTFIFLLLSIGMSAIAALSAKLGARDAGVDAGFLTPDMALNGLFALGLPVLMIQAAMVFTSEYRHNIASMTFSANPHRTQVIVAKWLLYGVIATVLTFVAVIGAYWVGIQIASGAADSSMVFSFSDDTARRLMWVYPLYAFTLVTLTIGVALLIRQTAGVVSLMLIWFIALEAVIGMLWTLGEKVVRFLPFTNFNAFMRETDVAGSPLSWQQSLWLYLAWVAAIFIIGTVVANRRDV
ncbi:multidrug ABC transporter permease [Corynebacterium mendelii]|uniref:Multidrug ABC transporter permease n=1 Tax=Corynebacterium mendelii TaxID=2765362 RepID=A0A939IWC3_9CORY|nr:multidrug ABC transporter permease [Corynebacterium mendelii]MBN9645141.1 multidrug ABC transporter permease [Corynebacterium mendelii]